MQHVHPQMYNSEKLVIVPTRCGVVIIILLITCDGTILETVQFNIRNRNGIVIQWNTMEQLKNELMIQTRINFKK